MYCTHSNDVKLGGQYAVYDVFRPVGGLTACGLMKNSLTQSLLRFFNELQL
jgi:hypothetical protein